MNIFSLNPDLIAWHMRVAQEKHEKVEDEIAYMIKDCIQSSCTILVYAENEHWSGSGFHLGEGVVCTASHVCPPELNSKPHEINITFDGKTRYKADIVASDPNIDCALLSCPQISKNIPYVTLGDSNKAEIGDIIAVIGSPEGWHDTSTVGRTSNVHQQLGEHAPSQAWNDIIFIDAKILQGVSGGMVIGTDGLVYGLVIGVTGQHAEIGIGENSVCPSNKIISFVNSITKSR